MISPTACGTPQPSQNLVEPSWNLVEPWWNPRGTFPQGRPGPPRSLSGLRPQSCQLLGGKKNRRHLAPLLTWGDQKRHGPKPRHRSIPINQIPVPIAETSRNLGAFCSPAKSLAFSLLVVYIMENPLVGKKVKVLPSKQNAPQETRTCLDKSPKRCALEMLQADDCNCFGF